MSIQKTNLKKKMHIIESRDEKDVIDLNRKELRDETKKQNSEKVQTKLFGTNTKLNFLKPTK